MTTGADARVTALFVGDELTFGLGASSEAQTYRAQVTKALAALGPVTTHRGGQVGGTLESVAESLTVPSNTDVVLLAVGTNDNDKTDPVAFSATYQALVAKVRAAVPDAALACAGLWGRKDETKAYDQAVNAACSAAGGRFVRWDDLFEDKTLHGVAGEKVVGGTSDAFHPNDAGYDAITARMLSALSLPG